MNYLILSQPSEEYAWNLSAALWQLASPASVQQAEGRETAYWVAPIVHPSNGDVALPLPDSLLNVHSTADIEHLIELISAAVTAEEADEFRATVEANRGGKLNVYDAIAAAPSLSPNLRTKEQLEVAGWFPTE